MTRRQWTTALGAALPLAAQVSKPPVTHEIPPLGSPTPSPGAADREAKLKKAVADVQQVSERLSQMEVAMNVEPAFAFRP